MATSNKTDVTNREFVSDASLFLRELETKTETNQSVARQAEEAKYARVNKLRDEVQKSEDKEKIWSGF